MGGNYSHIAGNCLCIHLFVSALICMSEKGAHGEVGGVGKALSHLTTLGHALPKMLIEGTILGLILY